MDRIFHYQIQLQKEDHIQFWVGKLVQKQVKYIGNRLLSLVSLGQVQMDMMFLGARFIGQTMVCHNFILIHMNIYLNIIPIKVVGLEKDLLISK